MQGEWPQCVHVELGSGVRESIRVHEIGSYARHAQGGMQRDVAADAPTEPIPCDHVCSANSAPSALSTGRTSIT